MQFGADPSIIDRTILLGQATSPDLTGSMNDGGRGSTDHASRKRLRDILIVAEVALAFVLLVGSGLMMRSFFRLLTVDTGFDSTNVLTIGVPVTTQRFPDSMRFKVVSPSYFSALKLKMVRGRPLSDRDAKSAPPGLVINERLAKREFENQDPIGQRLLIQEIIPGKTELGPEISWQVVGIVHDEKVNGIADDRSAGVYVSNEQSPVYFQTLNVRTSVDPLALQKSITAAIHRVNKDQALTDIRTVDQIKDLSMANNRVQSVLLGIFATVALLLAGIGIYGVISYSVAQRTHEIGIRAALGATERKLLLLVFGRGAILTISGLLIGVSGSLALTRLMASLLYGVGARDPATMVVVAALLGLVAVTACYVPARRATKIDPLVALKGRL